MREIKARAWNKVNKTMYTDAINNCKDTFDMVLKHPQVYEVMQYTGIKDKSGREIYDQDYCEKDGKIYQVQWVTDCAKWGVKVIKTKSVLSRNMTFPLQQYIHEWTNESSLSVIGNPYEHPHLLDMEDKA